LLLSSHKKKSSCFRIIPVPQIRSFLATSSESDFNVSGFGI
jgi:hypothetical protein